MMMLLELVVFKYKKKQEKKNVRVRVDESQVLATCLSGSNIVRFPIACDSYYVYQ